MNRNLNTEVSTRLIVPPLATGGTNHYSDYVDMQGYEGCRFVGIVGTVGSTSSVSMRIYGATSSTKASTSYTALSTGSDATVSSSKGEDDGEFVVDCYRPRYRYLKALITRTGSSAEFGGVIADRYGPRVISSTKSSTSAVATGKVFVQQTT